MTILHVIDSLYPAGAETLVCQLAESMTTHGIQSEIYVLQQTGSRLETECRSRGVAVYYSGIQEVYSPRQVRRLQLHLRKHPYDVIHSHLFPAQLWTALASRLECLRVPLATTEHSTDNRRRRQLWRLLDRWMYGRYDALVGVSDGVSNALSDWIMSKAQPVQTIRNGVMLNVIAEAPITNIKAELAIEGQMLAISVGRCELPKNYRCSLRALARTADLHLAILGDGSLMSQLRCTAETLGIGSRVHFLGHRNDVVSLLKGADFFVQASLWEGFGIAAVEAMAAGLPVIVSRVPGLAEVAGEAGVTFDPENEEELSVCMSMLANDAELRARLSALSRKRAADFDVTTTSARYAGLYRSLVHVV